jgi:hypothetical protein
VWLNIAPTSGGNVKNLPSQDLGCVVSLSYRADGSAWLSPVMSHMLLTTGFGKCWAKQCAVPGGSIFVLSE